MLRDLLKEGGLYTIANFLTKGISLLLIPFYTAYFSPSDYGIIDMLTVFGAFFNAIISLQLGQGLGRYVGDAKIHDIKKIKFASSAINLTILSYILFGIIAFWATDFFIDILSSDEVIQDYIFYLSLGAIMINGLFYCLGVYFRFLRLSKTFSVLSLSHAVGNILLTLFFVLVLGYGIDGVFIASLVVTPIMVAIQFYLLKGQYKFQIGKLETSLLFKFSIPLIPAAIAYTFLTFTDRLFINEYISSSELGVYGIGARFASVIGLIIAGFSMALNPIIYERHGQKTAPHELSRIFNLFIALGSFGVLMLSVFSIETLQIFTQEEYYGARTIMPILYTSLLFTGVWMFSPGLNIYKKTKITATIAIISSVLNIGLNYLLITEFGMMGTASATLISTIINQVVLFYWASKFYKIEVNWIKVIPTVLLFFGGIYMGAYWVDGNDISGPLYYVIKFGILGGFAVYLVSIKLIDPIFYTKLKALIKS